MMNTEKIFAFFRISNEVLLLFGIVFLILLFFTSLFFLLGKLNRELDLGELKRRTNSWWVITGLLALFLFLNQELAFAGVALLSALCLKELFEAIGMDSQDRYLLFFCYLLIPVQYYFAYIGHYQLFLIFIPVFAFFILPLHSLLRGDMSHYTQSVAVTQWSLMLAVYSLSHLVYLLSLDFPFDFSAGNKGVILYLIFLTQFNDVLQFLWGKLFGRRKILPKVSPNKTWAGFIGGVGTTTLLAWSLRFLTPFSIIQSLIAGFLIAVTGFVGDLNISAVKRNAGRKDMGGLIPGHGGVMDRLDSLSCSAPFFFHLLYFWYFR